MKELLQALCADCGISGSEEEMLDIISTLLQDTAKVTIDKNGSIIAEMGDDKAEKHLMLDAHTDRIGLIVTYIDKKGFLCAEPVGGIDLRTLPGSAVKIFGTEPVTGIICTMPPHLAEDSELSRDKIRIDTGLPAEKVKELIRPGDKVLLHSRFTELLGGRIAVSALDNRSGCAVLIRCARLLKGKSLPCRLSLVFSAQEETNEMGAGTAAYSLAPDEAVVIDVGFAAQEGVPAEKSGELGCTAIISISPALDKGVTKKLESIAASRGIKYSYEVCGGSTGTNADRIAAARGGVRTGVISIPCKNMHTPTEIVQLSDLEQLSELLAEYVLEGGADHA